MDEDLGAIAYGEILAAIGSQFDTRGCQDIILCEVVDGFVARATRGQEPISEGLAFSFDELSTLAATLSPAQDGEETVTYRTLFTALGRELDRLRARMITILDVQLGLLVFYYPVSYALEGYYGERYEFIYQPHGLRELLSTLGTGPTADPVPSVDSSPE